MWKKVLRRALAAICIAAVALWGMALARCEWLTARYCDAAVWAACEENPMIGGIGEIKVLDYIGYGCLKVYVKEADAGSILVLIRDDEGVWQEAYWDTVWSRTGSADGFVWPYIR